VGFTVKTHTSSGIKKIGSCTEQNIPAFLGPGTAYNEHKVIKYQLLYRGTPMTIAGY
jgi:hypothetical protein